MVLFDSAAPGLSTLQRRSTFGGAPRFAHAFVYLAEPELRAALGVLAIVRTDTAPVVHQRAVALPLTHRGGFAALEARHAFSVASHAQPLLFAGFGFCAARRGSDALAVVGFAQSLLVTGIAGETVITFGDATIRGTENDAASAGRLASRLSLTVSVIGDAALAVEDAATAKLAVL
jgi:hypothetical protein